MLKFHILTLISLINVETRLMILILFPPSTFIDSLDFFNPPLLVYCSYVLVFSNNPHPPRLFQPLLIQELLHPSTFIPASSATYQRDESSTKKKSSYYIMNLNLQKIVTLFVINGHWTTYLRNLCFTSFHGMTDQKPFWYQIYFRLFLFLTENRWLPDWSTQFVETHRVISSRETVKQEGPGSCLT